MDVTIRQARTADVDDVVGFTRDTWADHGRGDYLPDVFETWVETDGPEQRTLVADVDGQAVGTIQAVMLSPTEGWLQGLRVAPSYRGQGIGTELTHAGFSWARSTGATVARSMVFSWNEMGLGLARAAGFEPATEFRWAHPSPSEPPVSTQDSRETAVPADPQAAWEYWQRSDAADHLRGLALDMDESWAVAELTPARLERAASDTRLLCVGADPVRAIAYRTRTFEQETEEGDTTCWAEYGVGAWADHAACETLMTAVARDAADCGADQTRVLIPETVEAVSDVALAGHRLADDPDFVLSATLGADTAP